MAVPHILRRMRAFLTSGPARQALVVEAALLLLAARVVLLVVPFQRLARGWGSFVVPTEVAPMNHAVSPDARRIAIAVGWAVRATASVMPTKAMCLQQAVTARWMLARRGITSIIHYGAGRDESGALVAHAWLDAAGEEVTGHPVASIIAEIGAFVPQR